MGEDADRRARLVLGGCFGVLIAGILLAVVAMLLMSLAITRFYGGGEDPAGPAPTASP
ncbi:hypothetical protein [Microtetraspora glauca]|uniref:hypothetical protein n=1 Tax=unclassified Streptomyces TaxID=2593676 RepID=UPI000AB8EC25